MPNSYSYFKFEIRDWIIDNVPTYKRILDVGPGVGTYSGLLRDHGYRIDAVEIFPEYIKKYNLLEQYDNVFIGDICKFDIKDYDFIILGDVLEHIHKEDAIKLYERIVPEKECLVAVPFEMEQGEHEGNIYETHHQADLTPDVMKERYPKLSTVFKNQYYGYYSFIHNKLDRAYVLYANSSYFDTVCAAVESINKVSDVRVFVFLLNDNREVPGAQTVKWEYRGFDIKQTEYIDRNDSRVYDLLIQRPAVVKWALNKVANKVAYIDSDTVVTPYIDNIFEHVPDDTTYPYFTEGIYDYLFINGRGGVETREELHKSLEYPACELFGVDQSNRLKYRQTGYFVATKSCMDFLDEWEWMCNHPKVKVNPQYYAPYHEETLANVLLWKYNAQMSLPYMYLNYNKFVNIYDLPFSGETRYLEEWVRLPAKRSQLLALHGEKRPEFMRATMNQFKRRILFLAPHLSTGGMPAFLLKRIEALKDHYHIIVAEHKNFSDEFVVQKNKIKELVEEFHTLKGDDPQELQNLIASKMIDLVHIDEMSESLDDKELIDALYCNCRSYRIVETCHNISFKPDVEKKYHPDAYAFCTPHHLTTFKDMKTPIKEVIEFPIEPTMSNKLQAQSALGLDSNKKHVVNIGLWTKGKNQGEGLSLARKFPDVQFHFVGNQAGNFKDYWEPLMENVPVNVTIWGERHDTTTFLQAADVFMFNSTWECNPLVIREAIGYGLPILARNLPQYGKMFTPYITDLHPMKIKNQLKTLLRDGCNYIVPIENILSNFTDNHVDLYTKVLTANKLKHSPPVDYSIYRDFALGPYVHITGSSKSLFRVEMYDGDELIYNTIIPCGAYAKVDRKYYTKWRTVIYKDDILIMDDVLNLENKRVHIGIDSAALGDSIAWISYALEFQQKHKCNVVVSTYKNFLFEDVYPELEFIKPGWPIGDVYASYKIGWFSDQTYQPVLPNTIPLQQTASNILGLEHKEIVPRIKSDFGNVTPKNCVTIATNSTAGCKFWTREGWQEVINYLHDKGYKVINTSKEDNPFENCEKIADTSLEYTIDCIRQSAFFIGLSSGLSWLAWALRTEVVMISNFTEANHEFTCHRVTDTSICHGCWNNPKFTFDRGDWDWCPEHKGTDRQFECHTKIPASKVIDIIQPLIENKYYYPNN